MIAAAQTSRLAATAAFRVKEPSFEGCEHGPIIARGVTWGTTNSPVFLRIPIVTPGDRLIGGADDAQG